MNDTLPAGFSLPRNATGGGRPWDRKSKPAAHARGPVPAEPARLRPRGLVDVAGRRTATAGLAAALGDAAGGHDLLGRSI
ncbi:hypothetical protein Scani_39300 [Streptomyces caniferus]|uniref:Uncharacterized protein n=1 Tax=Streptomyces caniferus TaxID=285557 RepID=A0A640SAW8_9ACTN|nr:hypothetical protein Scani_39300 [Streptomyces caniferus]